MSTNLKQELENALSQLDAFLKKEKPGREQTLDYLRTTPLPFINCYYEELSPSDMFHYSFRFLHLLGQYNVALAVGLCMNQYIAFSIACFPAKEGTTTYFLKQQFLAIVKQNSWLLAVSSFDDFIRNKSETGNQVRCVPQSDGTFLCNGTKNFQSNISGADILLFSGNLSDQEVGLFYTFLKVPGISLGEALYPGAMADTDTRSVHFKDLQLSQIQMVPSGEGDENQGLHALTRVVFAVMAMAPYLGGAHRAMVESGTFLKNVHLEGKPLAELDGYITDMGRLQLQYRICESLVAGFESKLALLNAGSVAEWLETEGPNALAIKYHVTAVCENLVDSARKIIGTRSLLPAHIVSALSQQILFAALHPVLNAKIERDFGNGFLSRL